MIGGKRVLAVIPARGGSKGLPRKNLRELGGVPLVVLAGRVARQIPEIDRAVVSTDSPEISAVAVEGGLAAPFVRPESLSGDLIGDVDVLLHALDATEQADGTRYEIIVMLQPTSPLRTAEEVRSCLEMFAANDADSVWSVSRIDRKYHPLKQLCVDRGRLSYYDSRGSAIIARQQLDDMYIRNGVAYVISRDCLTERRSLMGARAFAWLTTAPHISIDTADDLARAEKWAQESSDVRARDREVR
jgi:CMP-N,N'-diacetyllegionaminic acid synthase